MNRLLTVSIHYFEIKSTLMKREIIQMGHPILLQVATEVDPTSTSTESLVADLFETIPLNGVGLAAPQIAKPYRAFIVNTTNSKRDIVRIKQAFVNPVIEAKSEEMESGWESCLSIRTSNGEIALHGMIERHSWVEVSWDGTDGKRQRDRFEGFVARIIQHEYDHLDGILFLDRIQDKLHLVTGKYYDDHIRGK
jgi:peptide deformylase